MRLRATADTLIGLQLVRGSRVSVATTRALCRCRQRFGLLLRLAVCCLLPALPVGSSLHSARAADLSVLRWADEGIADLVTLDPASIGDETARLAMGFVFEGLVRQGPNLTVAPAAADRWTVSKDGRTYTFWLRPDLRFGDGAQVTSADVVYSLDRALSPAFSRTANLYVLGNIEDAAARSAGKIKILTGVRALSPDVVRITLSTPVGSFLTRLGLPEAAIVPRTRILRQGSLWTEHAMGTGPFVVQSWQHGHALQLVPNRYYYGPRPRVALSIVFVPEPTTAFKLFQAGALDVMGSIAFPADQVYRVDGDPQFHRTPTLATTFLMLNERYAPLNQDHVREALAHALNKPPLVSAVLGTLAQATDGMLPPGMPGYDPHLLGARYDPALARALLAQAGYPGGRGFPSLVFSTDQGTQNLLLAGAIVQQWHDVLGITVGIAQAEHNTYNQRLTKLAFQIAPVTWTADWPDPENFLTQLLRSGGHNNNGGWSNAQFDRLVGHAGRLAGDTSQRLSLYRRAEALAMRHAATIPIANPQAGILIRSTVVGLRVAGGAVMVPDWSRVRVGTL
jgi:oligopeptide transport system substrate-binding protein